ncbi:MAG: tRNA lysidine(34) synthetase TilS [Chloroflexi bacterium]|nr:MAG: tRNA lysidine(34) synthetase TilS [Chloroflexota bacterium]
MATGVFASVAAACRKHGLLRQNDSVVVGVSGGADSLCLLHLLVNLQSALNLRLTVAHLNHQLRPVHANADAQFVAQLAQKWNLPLEQERQNVAELAAGRKQSVEEAARQARYAFLWRVAHRVGAAKIAVGHNADDQVETVLMHFLRGSGLHGLRGMLPAVPVSGLRLHPDDIAGLPLEPSPQIIRPLLDISRADIEEYCQTHHLFPRQDYTNQDTTYFRNRLRHELLPQLESYNPNIRQVIRRTARVVAADVQLLKAQLDAVWPEVARTETTQQIVFDRERWLALPLALKRATIRRAVNQLRHSLRDIGFEHVETAVSVAELGQTGAQATLPAGLRLVVSYNQLVVAPVDSAAPPPDTEPWLAAGSSILLAVPGVTPLPGSPWRLAATLLPAEDADWANIQHAGRWEAYLDADVAGEPLTLRTRQPGDVFCPLGMAGHRQKLNEFMINQKIPAHRRPHIPLLAAGKQVLWVCGFRPDERAQIKSNTKQVLYLSFETG